MTDNLIVEGKWFNKYNGSIVEVRDCALDGENMQIITKTGEVIDGESFMNNYIQYSDDVYDTNGTVIGNEPIDFSKIITENDDDSKRYPNIEETVNENAIFNTGSNPIIVKFFEKIDDKLKENIKLDINLEWKEIPSNELKMMFEYFDIDKNEIIDYMIDKYFNIESLKEKIKETLLEIIS